MPMMPVSLSPSPKSASSSSAAISATRKHTRTPIPGDHSYNYTLTYGYNFGYIANGLDSEKQQHLVSLPSIASRTSPTASSIPLTSSTTEKATTKSTSGSTRVSLSFPPTSGASTTGPLLKAASSAHPFSPHYSAYIELVASGGLSKVEEHRDTTVQKKTKPSKTTKKVVVRHLNSHSLASDSRRNKSPSPPHQLLDAVRIASPKRKAQFEDEEHITDEMQGIEEGRHGEDAMDYFSMPKAKSSSKKVRMTKDDTMQIRDGLAVSSPPLEDPPSSSSGSASTSELFSTALGLSTSGTWAATPSLIFTPGVAGGVLSREDSDGTGKRQSSSNANARASKSFTNRSPSPMDSFNTGSMINLDLLDRPRSPGVFTQARQGRRKEDAVHSVKEPRPRGLWRARVAAGPRAPLPSILNMNAGAGKSKGTTDTKSHRLNPYTPTPTTTSFSDPVSGTASGSVGSGIESAIRRESRLGETGYCSSSSCSSYSSDEMSAGEVANLKRRRIRKTASGKEVEGYEDDGSLSSTSSIAASPSTLQKRARRQPGPETLAGHRDDVGADPHQHKYQQQQQSRNTLLSTATAMATTTTRTASTSTQTLTDGVLQDNDDLTDATKYFTRSKIMDTTSLARTRFSDRYAATSPRENPPPPPEVTFGDWEDLKEVWARCLEVIDTEEPEEILPLLRAIIHECGRFLEAFQDPSVFILAPPPEPTSSKVDSGVATNSATPPAKGSMPPPPVPARKAQPPPFVHPKDLPTAFHTLLGTALFFFGNLIGEAPHLALEGEPTSKVFYHLYAIDVFEMGENVPARTGVQREIPLNASAYKSGTQTPHCQDDCCIPGSKEDWRLSTTWGRALVSLAEELLAREKICEEWLAQNPQPSPPVMEGNGDGYFDIGRPTYFGQGGAPPSAPFRPNPASFLSEDFISSGGVVREGYFGGTGGQAMGLRVDGMGGLSVAHPCGTVSGYSSPHGGLQLPSALYPLSSFNLMDGHKTPDRNVGDMASSPRVLSPFGTLAIGEPSSSRRSAAFANGLPSPSETASSSAPSPCTALEDPRKHWQRDSPFVVIWNRMPPVTRRMVLGGTHVNGANPFPSPALPTPPEPSTFTLSWWNTDDSHMETEGNGRYPSAMSWNDGTGVTAKSPSQKPKNKKNPGASVDEMMGLAVDHLSRGLFHMPRTGLSRGLGGVGGIAGGPVDPTNGRPGKSLSSSHSHRHRHHHHQHRHSHRPQTESTTTVGGVQPFSRAAHLLTIAMEVLMLAEQLPSPQSRYRWASHADSIFEQMRLEESPGIIKPPRREDGMDVDIDLATGHVSSKPDRVVWKKKSFSRMKHESPLDAPLHSFAQGLHAPPSGSLDSNRNAVILQARGRCSLIIGSSIAEDKIEMYLEELDSEATSRLSTGSDTQKRRVEVIKLLRGEDAEEARAKLRESVDFLERARGVWREGVAGRRKEREKTRARIERERKARRDAVAMQERTKGTQRSPRSPLISPVPSTKRRGIGALAAENKKKRRSERASVTKDTGMVEDDRMLADADVEMGDAVPTSPPPSAQNFEEGDALLLASLAVEDDEEEAEEKEYARLIAEAVVTLANILLVPEEGDEELGMSPVSETEEAGCEKEREELYAKGQEEMRRAGLEEVDCMI